MGEEGLLLGSRADSGVFLENRNDSTCSSSSSWTDVRSVRGKKTCAIPALLIWSGVPTKVTYPRNVLDCPAPRPCLPAQAVGGWGSPLLLLWQGQRKRRRQVQSSQILPRAIVGMAVARNAAVPGWLW